MLQRCRAALYARAPIVSALGCGTRVVTFDEPSPVSSVGIFFEVGSRYETPETAGCAAVMERLGQRGNRRHNARQLRQLFARFGSPVHAVHQRELMYLRADCVRWEMEDVLDVLFGMAVDLPVDDAAAIDAARDAVMADTVAKYRDPARCIPELVHQAAYRRQGLGRPSPSPAELARLTPAVLRGYVQMLVRPERLCVVARGVEHDDLRSAAAKQVAASFAGSVPVPLPVSLRARTQYTGGESLFHTADAGEQLTHASVLFEGVGADDPDFFPKSIARALLGGGEAGVPSRWPSSKLNRDCVGKYRWVRLIACNCVTFKDSGLFGIYGQAVPGHANHLLTLIAQQLASVTDSVDAAQLQRAKNQFKSQVFMAMEERGVSVEDIGRSVSLYGRAWSPEEIVERVDQTTLADIRAVLDRVRSSRPTLAVYGDTRGIPSLATLEEHVREVAGVGGGQAVTSKGRRRRTGSARG
eukprot:TRINITY_DN4650_c1_g1_i1.p1 TRINITY_DN4650_c1_g1~~TRINITY_DN4650_c1_g1_i1.p1  ORF type:complete len:470 (+),score=171.30 TRINITY_DN4650_c1_g1_i1:283-1692(+)